MRSSQGQSKLEKEKKPDQRIVPTDSPEPGSDGEPPENVSEVVTPNWVELHVTVTELLTVRLPVPLEVPAVS